MRQAYIEELNILNKELIEMGSMVERSLDKSVRALIEKDMDLAVEVIEYDGEINEKERAIEKRCFNLILKEQPVAGDLRNISSILKLIRDLERIGDYAQDISEITLDLAGQDHMKEIIDIKTMLDIVLNMVELSLDAFINKDINLARQVISLDDKVDDLFDMVKDDLIELIILDGKNAKQGLNLMMLAKYLERVADHAENISEWVIFSIKGLYR